MTAIVSCIDQEKKRCYLKSSEFELPRSDGEGIRHSGTSPREFVLTP
jgi:hypothetical protein